MPRPGASSCWSTRRPGRGQQPAVGDRAGDLPRRHREHATGHRRPAAAAADSTAAAASANSRPVASIGGGSGSRSTGQDREPGPDRLGMRGEPAQPPPHRRRTPRPTPSRSADAPDPAAFATSAGTDHRGDYRPGAATRPAAAAHASARNRHTSTDAVEPGPARPPSRSDRGPGEPPRTQRTTYTTGTPADPRATTPRRRPRRHLP